MVPACNFTEQQVQEAFLNAPPLIAQTILDLTIQHPSFLRDMWEVEAWPLGNGTLMEQLVFRGAMPQIERGFDQWKKQSNNTGCDPCEGPDCGYNVTYFGGNGFERKVTELMARDFFSPSYCVKEIQTTAHFKEVFSKIIENLYAQVSFFKEMNIGLNFLSGLAKKFVVDSGGFKANRNNPYVYRPVGTTRLATLNIEGLEFLYEQMRRMPEAVPYDVVNGAPIYSLMASHQLLARLYRDDPKLREDVRFSGLSNDALMKYNFMSTIRGMFIAAPILYPRRFNVNVASGEVEEVLPFINGIPMEVGAFTGLNPEYELATHEEVLIHGKFPFKLFYMPTTESLGENTSFGPEPSFFDYWSWINPMTTQDPFRRQGYFATSVQLGLSQQYSDGIFGWLVERPSQILSAVFTPNPTCPEDPPVCDNEVADVGCPCPLIVSSIPNPITAGNFFLTLAVAVDVVVDDVIQLGVDTGGYVEGTVVSVNADGTVIEVTITDSEALAICDRFTSVWCDDTLGCSATVFGYDGNCDDTNNINLSLSNPIKGDVGEDVEVYFGDGTSVTATIVSQNMLTGELIVALGAAFCDQVGGILKVCVPSTTDASCNGCAGLDITACAT